jgi:DNA-binding transcriptional ArsR family regulator
MQPILAITKALADPSRLRVLAALRGRELCACQITEVLGLAQSTMSKHFALLKHAGLVDSRKEGRWVYFALPEKPTHTVRGVLKWLHRSLESDPNVAEDARNLRRILKCDPAELCKKQCGR